MRNDTPPSSVHGDDEVTDEFGFADEDEAIYLGDADEVLGLDDDDPRMNDGEESDASTDETKEPQKDDAIIKFTKHVGSVFCGSLHPERKIAVTGGEDDKAFVWNTETGEVIFEVAEHKDSVIIGAFSFDGVYLATADMLGFVRVLKVPPKNEDSWVCVWDYQADDLSWGCWHPGARVLFCGAVPGDVYVFRIPSGETKVLQGTGQKSECGQILADGRRLAVGYADGGLKIWDIKSSSVLHSIGPEHAHNDSISAIDCSHDNNLIITGSTDRKAVLTKTSTGKSAGQLEVDSDIETIAFCKDSSLGLVAIGTLDSPVTIWEVGRQAIRHKCVVPDSDAPVGVTLIKWIDSYLITACLDGTIKIFEGRSGDLVRTLYGHSAEILDFCYSTVNKILLSTSEDGTSRIFNLELPSTT